MRMVMSTGLFTLLLCACSSPAAPEPAAAQSDDWRDAVIYFAMIDRFDDGDPGNNDQGEGEYDPADSRRFSGGDLAGLTRRLDYVRELGASALWITPPVANQWWDPQVNYGGYHGYWAQDFTQVDAHFGDQASYRALADGLHARGMKLVQDVVLNHSANFFYCTAPGECVRHNETRVLPAPLHHNDPNNPDDRALDLWHWNPTIVDYSDREQNLNWQLADLDDLNTENAQVRQVLRQIYGDWIERIGVDGFRVDTAFHMPEDYFRDFLYSDDPQAPGILRRHPFKEGKGFHVFGEGFGLDKPLEDSQARRIEAYTGDADGPLLPAMINFPLYGTLREVFAQNHPAAELGWRIENMMQVHSNPWLMPTFIDNHDVDRFLSESNETALRQALLAILTLPGIPVIYYGTEQGFTGRRDAMFAGGYGSGGIDHFDTGAPLFGYLKTAISLRREHRVFSRGTPAVLHADGEQGALVYKMEMDEGSAMVAFNTAEAPRQLQPLDTGLATGTQLQPLFAIDGEAPAVTVDSDGQITLSLPARSGWVWKVQ